MTSEYLLKTVSQHRYVDGVLRTLCGEAISELVDDHFYISATNAIIAETIGEIAPVAAEEALTEIRAQACRDQVIEAELEAWMRIIAEETLGELHGVDSQVGRCLHCIHLPADNCRSRTDRIADLPICPGMWHLSDCLAHFTTMKCRMLPRRMMPWQSSL